MFEPSQYSGAPAPVSDYSKEAGKEDAAQSGLAKAGAAVAVAGGVAAAIPAVPFAQIAGLVTAGVGLGLTVAGKVVGRNAKLLRGDESAIAPFIKHYAKMKAAKRKKAAARLLKQFQAHQKKHNHKPNSWKARDNLLKLKLGAVYAAENHSRKHPNKALEPGGLTPAQIEAAKSAVIPGVPNLWLGVGVVGLGAAALLILKRRRT